MRQPTPTNKPADPAHAEAGEEENIVLDSRESPTDDPWAGPDGLFHRGGTLKTGDGLIVARRIGDFTEVEHLRGMRVSHYTRLKWQDDEFEPVLEWVDDNLNGHRERTTTWEWHPGIYGNWMHHTKTVYEDIDDDGVWDRKTTYAISSRGTRIIEEVMSRTPQGEPLVFGRDGCVGQQSSR